MRGSRPWSALRRLNDDGRFTCPVCGGFGLCRGYRGRLAPRSLATATLVFGTGNELDRDLMRPRRARCRAGLLCVSLVCLGGLAAASQWIWWSEWIDRLIDAGSRVELEAIPLKCGSDKWLFIPVGDQWQDKARGRPPYLQLKRGTLDPRHHLQAADIGRCVRLSGRLTAPERPGKSG